MTDPTFTLLKTLQPKKTEFDSFNQNYYQNYAFLSAESSAEKIILLFLECVAAIVPHDNRSEDVPVKSFLSNNDEITDFLSAEALIVLRKFLSIHSWREVLLSVAQQL